jgi:hypothetical protein
VPFFSGSLGGTSRIYALAKRPSTLLFAAVLLTLPTVPLVARAVQDTTPDSAKATSSVTRVTAESTSEDGAAPPISPSQADDDEPSVQSQASQNTLVEVTVNGRDVMVPKNGTITETTNEGDTKTTITVQASNSSTGDATERSKLRITSKSQSTESITNRSTSQVTEEGELQ